VDHSRRMLEREIGYVHRDFAQSLLVEHPAAYVRLFAEVSYHYLFQVTGLERFGLWLHQPPDPDGYRLQLWLRGLFAHIAEHVIAAVNITQVFALRLGVLTLAMPVFVLFGSVAVVDGLVQRDLRRWGGGRESSFLYHHAKRLVWPSIVMAWVVYLAMPVSVHPNFVILPVRRARLGAGDRGHRLDLQEVPRVISSRSQIGVHLGGEFDTCHPAQASAAQLSWLRPGRGLACGPLGQVVTHLAPGDGLARGDDLRIALLSHVAEGVALLGLAHLFGHGLEDEGMAGGTGAFRRA
jgi:integrating conjugative element membrane protein (TIGR03747 family)